MKGELALGKLSEYLGWCERSFWMEHGQLAFGVFGVWQHLHERIIEGLPLVEKSAARVDPRLAELPRKPGPVWENFIKLEACREPPRPSFGSTGLREIPAVVRRGAEAGSTRPRIGRHRNDTASNVPCGARVIRGSGRSCASCGEPEDPFVTGPSRSSDAVCGSQRVAAQAKLWQARAETSQELHLVVRRPDEHRG